ncbi:hypothetical protein IKE07_01865 [Candidatus Saccharibacteria bacterium]|nr:hypothetical protein [Candidatus Saccharibacteria bacterium]
MKKSFRNIQPGHGTIHYEQNTKKERADKIKEYKEAERLLREVGGNFLILRESRKQGISTPDISRNKTEYIEIKHPDSLVALDTRLRQGIMQLLYEKNQISSSSLKVLILILGKKMRHVSDAKIRQIVNQRLKEVWKCELDLIIIRNGNKKLEIYP